MMPLRIGAVGYLNAQPLVYGLDRRPDRVALRFDAPSRCAMLLAEGAIDLGLIPSIEYLRGGGYRVVPGLSIASRGPVASVALYTARPLEDVRSIAADSSSRTSVALLRVLCADRFRIDPAFETRPPDLDAMLQDCDAALVIGDHALFADHTAAGLRKIDLGEEWTAMTGLPFVWAFWAGRPGILDAGDIAMLRTARDDGIRAVDRIAAAYCGPAPEKVAVGRRYLVENIQYGLGEAERAGLARFYQLARRHQLVPELVPLGFYEAAGVPSAAAGRPE